jgi:RHS repeat-associated protein
MSKTSGGTTTQFLWDLAGGLPLLLKDGSASYIYGPGGSPLEQIASSTTSYLHHDQIGSTRLITNSSGSSVATYRYDSYGNLVASTGTITNPFRFAGQYQDSESGLYYLRARYYDPTTGQFVTCDPIVAKTRQPYAYAGGAPLNLSDPSGLCDWWNPLCGVQQWASQNTQRLEQEAVVAEHSATLMSVVAISCGLLAIATAETVAGAVIFGTCAETAAGLAMGATLSAGVMHGLASTGESDPYVAQQQYQASEIDFASLALSNGSGIALRILCEDAGLGPAAQSLSGLWGRASTGIWTKLERKAQGLQ